ncbi:MAG: cyclic nucleotide-binding domain-containing protein [Legionellales bacterium]
MDPFNKQEILKHNSLFTGLTEVELETIASIAVQKTYKSGEYIIHEEEMGHELYIILEGKVEILKKLTDLNHDIPYKITTLSAGETIGEIALLDNSIRIASARASLETTLLMLPVKELRNISTSQAHNEAIRKQLDKLVADIERPPVGTRMALNLAKNLSTRLLNTDQLAANALKQALVLSQMRVAMGQFIISLITTLVLYAYFLSILSRVEASIQTRTLLALTLGSGFIISALYFMLTSGYPKKFFGLSFSHWFKNALEGIAWSIPIMGIIVLLKYSIIHYYGLNMPLFDWSGKLLAGLTPLALSITITSYCLLVPVQELIARGAIQGALQEFLTWKHNTFAAVIVSNLVFSMIHLHLSAQVALSVFLLGLVWGWLYAKQRSLVGVTVSHLIVGVWSLYCVGMLTVLDSPA